MGSPLGSKNGKITLNSTEVLDVTSWNVEKVADNKPYASSSTAGYRKRVSGVKDWTGTLEVLPNDTPKLESYCEVGDTKTVELFLDGTLKYSGPIIIDKIGVKVDIQSGEVIAGTVDFSGNGAWTNY